jgi:hypothetical protein
MSQERAPGRYGFGPFPRAPGSRSARFPTDTGARFCLAGRRSDGTGWGKYSPAVPACSKKNRFFLILGNSDYTLELPVKREEMWTRKRRQCHNLRHLKDLVL